MKAAQQDDFPSYRAPPPRQLTAAIKAATSIDRLAELYHAYHGIFNHIHIAALVSHLPKLNLQPLGVLDWQPAEGVQDRTRDLLLQLLAHIRAQGCQDYSPRALANIIWALARLQYAPDAELRAQLVASFCRQLGEAVPHDISNVLWGVAKLTMEAPTATSMADHMAPATSTCCGPSCMGSASASPAPAGEQQRPGTGGTASTSSSSSCGMRPVPAGAAAPFLSQDMLRLLLSRLCQHIDQGACGVQTISNSLWAVTVMQQAVGWCMCNCQREVRHLLEAFCRHPAGVKPGHIQTALRAMCQLAAACANHAGPGWLSWQPSLLVQLLRYLHQQRSQLEQHQVASILRDVGQLMVLHTLVIREAVTRSGRRPAMPGAPTLGTVAAALGAAAGDGGTGQLGMDVQQKQQQGGLPATPGAAAGDSKAATADNNSSAQLPEEAAAFGVTSISASSATAAGGLQPHTTSSSRSSSKGVLKHRPLDDLLLGVVKGVAAVAGPWDLSSTLLVLHLLQQPMAELALLGKVQSLCALLPISCEGSLPPATLLSKDALAAHAAGLVAAALAAGPEAAAGSRLDKLLLALSLQRMADVPAVGGIAAQALAPCSAPPLSSSLGTEPQQDPIGSSCLGLDENPTDGVVEGEGLGQELMQDIVKASSLAGCHALLEQHRDHITLAHVIALVNRSARIYMELSTQRSRGTPAAASASAQDAASAAAPPAAAASASTPPADAGVDTTPGQPSSPPSTAAEPAPPAAAGAGGADAAGAGGGPLGGEGASTPTAAAVDAAVIGAGVDKAGQVAARSAAVASQHKEVKQQQQEQEEVEQPQEVQVAEGEGDLTPQQLLQLLQPCLLQLLPGAQPQQHARLLWACGCMCASPPMDVLQLLMEGCQLWLRQASARECADLLWSLSCLDPSTAHSAPGNPGTLGSLDSLNAAKAASAAKAWLSNKQLQLFTDSAVGRLIHAGKNPSSKSKMRWSGSAGVPLRSALQPPLSYAAAGNEGIGAGISDTLVALSRLGFRAPNQQEAAAAAAAAGGGKAWWHTATAAAVASGATNASAGDPDLVCQHQQQDQQQQAQAKGALAVDSQQQEGQGQQQQQGTTSCRVRGLVLTRQRADTLVKLLKQLGPAAKLAHVQEASRALCIMGHNRVAATLPATPLQQQQQGQQGHITGNTQPSTGAGGVPNSSQHVSSILSVLDSTSPPLHGGLPQGPAYDQGWLHGKVGPTHSPQLVRPMPTPGTRQPPQQSPAGAAPSARPVIAAPPAAANAAAAEEALGACGGALAAGGATGGRPASGHVPGSLPAVRGQYEGAGGTMQARSTPLPLAPVTPPGGLCGAGTTLLHLGRGATSSITQPAPLPRPQPSPSGSSSSTPRTLNRGGSSSSSSSSTVAQAVRSGNSYTTGTSPAYSLSERLQATPPTCVSAGQTQTWQQQQQQQQQQEPQQQQQPGLPHGSPGHGAAPATYYWAQQQQQDAQHLQVLPTQQSQVQVLPLQQMQWQQRQLGSWSSNTAPPHALLDGHQQPWAAAAQQQQQQQPQQQQQSQQACALAWPSGLAYQQQGTGLTSAAWAAPFPQQELLQLQLPTLAGTQVLRLQQQEPVQLLAQPLQLGQQQPAFVISSLPASAMGGGVFQVMQQPAPQLQQQQVQSQQQIMVLQQQASGAYTLVPLQLGGWMGQQGQQQQQPSPLVVLQQPVLNIALQQQQEQQQEQQQHLAAFAMPLPPAVPHPPLQLQLQQVGNVTNSSWLAADGSSLAVAGSGDGLVGAPMGVAAVSAGTNLVALDGGLQDLTCVSGLQLVTSDGHLAMWA